MLRWSAILSDGSIDVPDGEPMNIDVSLLKNLDSVEKFEKLCNEKSVFSQVVHAIKLNGIGLTPQSQNKIIKFALNETTFSLLREVHLFNMKMTDDEIDLIVHMISPTGVRCKWNVIRLSNCWLNMSKLTRLMRGVKENIALEEIDISGNRSNDDPIQILKDCIVNYDNKIQYLGLADNNISDKGLQFINQLLASPRNKLLTLNLSNNPAITSTYLTNTFESMLSYPQLRELSLSGCSIKSCNWCNYLPFLSQLQLLNLSYNQINDLEFTKILRCIEYNTSLIRLNLSHNQLTGKDCGFYFQSFLETNGSLQYLNVSSNYFHASVQFAESIAKGLIHNQSLLQIDCSNCMINFECFSILSFGFQYNATCDIVLEDNPLSFEITRAPRDYIYQVHMRKNGGNTMGNTGSSLLKTSSTWSTLTKPIEDPIETSTLPKEVMLLAPRRERMSDDFTRAWRKTTWEKIILSLKSIAIKENLQSTDNDQPANGSKISIGKETRLPEYLFQQYMWQLSNVHKSEYYHTVSKLDAMVADLQQMNTLDTQRIIVSYGQRDSLVGYMSINTKVNYLQLRELIKPFLLTYLQNILSDNDAQQEEFMNFHMLDPKGKRIPVEQMRERLVWKDLYLQAEPNILLKPFNWISLDDD